MAHETLISVGPKLPLRSTESYAAAVQGGDNALQRLLLLDDEPHLRVVGLVD